jgi:hypothetical protein
MAEAGITIAGRAPKQLSSVTFKNSQTYADLEYHRLLHIPPIRNPNPPPLRLTFEQLRLTPCNVAALHEVAAAL